MAAMSCYPVTTEDDAFWGEKQPSHHPLKTTIGISPPTDHVKENEAQLTIYSTLVILAFDLDLKKLGYLPVLLAHTIHGTGIFTYMDG